MRWKKRKINTKRFYISLAILIISLILTTKISLKYAAKNFNTDDTTLDPDSQVLEEEMEEEVSKEDLPKEELALQEMEDKVEEQEESEVDTKSDKEPEKKEMDKETKKSANNLGEYNRHFTNDLFIGDSITDSLSFYELIDEGSVIAQLGFTTKKAKDEIENIINKNPNNIYIMFGMNDILTFKDKERFIIHYSELIDGIHNNLPDTNIYVQSILPVSSEVKEKKPLLSNENIDSFNQSLLDMAENKGVKYLNIRSIMENNMDLLEPDGIHVKYKFYELWLEYLIDNTK